MPIGVIANCLGIIIGGIAGSFIGPRLTESFKTNLNLVFGACAMTMGISSISLMKNMPAVILSVILGTVIGLIIHLGNLTQKMGMGMEKIISKIIPGQSKKDADLLINEGIDENKIIVISPYYHNSLSCQNQIHNRLLQ